MNLKIKFIIFLLMLSFVSLGCGGGMTDKSQPESQPASQSTSQPTSQLASRLEKTIWEALPLRTLAQKEAGLMGGEGMQGVLSISYASSNPNIAYFVSNTSQVWKSIDGGHSWHSKRNGFRSNGGVSLFIDPKNEDVVYVSGSRHIYSWQSSNTSPVDGIYRTLDGGESWQLVKQTTYYAGIEGQHFAFDPRSFNGVRHMTVYAGTHAEGLLKSIDGGDSWTVLGMTDQRIFDVEMNMDITSNSIILYIAAKKGLYKVIDDNSIIITKIGAGLPDYNYPRTIALNPQDDPNNDIIYAATGKYKIYKSTDGGQTFVRKSTGIDPVLEKEFKIIDISKADPNYLYVSVEGWDGNNPFYSHDGGENWQQPTDLNVDGLHFIDGTYLSGTTATHPEYPDVALRYFLGGKIMITTNGGDTWRYSGDGYMGARRSRNKTSTYFDPINSMRKIFFLIDFGPAITEDNGDTWELLPVPYVNGSKSTPVGTVDPNNHNIIITPIGTGSSQNISKSIDGGQSWTVFDYTTDNYWFICFHPQDSNYVYAGTLDSGSWISNDSGNSWIYIDRKSIRAVFPDNGDIVYAFEACVDTDDPIEGCTRYKSILWHSDNRGENWTQIAINPFKSNVYDVDIDPNNSNRLYVASEGGLYAFNGTEWIETGKSGGIPTETFGNKETFSVHNIVVDPNNPNIIYAGMWAPDFGNRKNFIFRSNDYGLSWQNISLNLDDYSIVWSLAVDPANSNLYMNTAHGNYVLPFDNDIYIAEIDIKPDSKQNSINLKSKGVISVAILTTEDFDATTVYPLSVEFIPDEANEAHGKGHIEDVDEDGDLDLVMHFRTQDTGIACGADLRGETFDGQKIKGFDSITTIGCR
jgi:photosystem II stability/assembly factor-like uncharacterized protein